MLNHAFVLHERNSAGQLSLTKDLIGDDIPKYAILSHIWGMDAEEVTFRDMIDGTSEDKPGYDKVRFCGERAKRDRLRFFWVNTCYINKSNAVELQKAINLMFRWYQNTAKYYVYLSDVSTRKRKAGDRLSEHTWELAFLLKLLAPGLGSVEFFSQEKDHLGDKRTLEQQIHEITGIPITTTYEEDKAYSLFGIFNIQIPLLYGKGKNKALKRL
ncbi:hypothetical protein BGZ57DRAFT_943814 [Hyaloscypha finlandica]|nr:hypothetical protein BGZ57DRAFT_943814 [Hyaloscypha finlandica]